MTLEPPGSSLWQPKHILNRRDSLGLCRSSPLGSLPSRFIHPMAPRGTHPTLVFHASPGPSPGLSKRVSPILGLLVKVLHTAADVQMPKV